MDERVRKAFDFAQDVTKQLITLSTGILALTITFLKDVASEEGAASWVEAAWVLYLLSVFFGIWTLLALTGTLERVGGDGAPPSIRGRNVTTPSLLQIGCFIAALALTIVFGVKAV